MKLRKFNLSYCIILCGSLLSQAHAYGHCVANMYWYGNPFILAIFFTSICYGLTIYFIYGVRKIVRFKTISLSSLLLLLISYGFYFLATELFLIFIGLVGGTIYCYLMPLRYHKKAKLQDDNISKKIIETRRISLVLLPVFFVVSLGIGAIWQVKVKAYFNKNLVKMIGNGGVILSLQATEKLISIEDINEKNGYITELRQVISDESFYHKHSVLSVLKKWNDIGSVPYIVRAWRNESLNQNEAIETLKTLTGQEFSSIEEWEQWIDKEFIETQ